jgi:hypothetical protein
MNATRWLSRLGACAAAALISGLSCSLSAALITWGAATNIAGDADVSTAGNLVGAFRFVEDGVVAGATVNGVNFQAFQITGNSNTVGNFNLSSAAFFPVADTSSASPPYSSLSTEYQTLLSSAAASGTAMFLTMNGLTIGQTYQAQFWVNDSNLPAPVLMVIDQKVLDANTTDADGGIGQHIIGTFTADSTSQTFVAFGEPDGLLNGFQLRALAVPAPGSLFVTTVVGLVSAWKLRRRLLLESSSAA